MLFRSVFEDKAQEILSQDTTLKKVFEERKKSDEKFSADPEAQLNFIYEHSAYFEKSYKRYPVARIMERLNLLKN